MLVKCEWCKTEFNRSRTQVREHVFCNSVCWGRFRTASRTITKICKVCGDSFSIASCYAANFSTCSKIECRKQNRETIIRALHESNTKGRMAKCHPHRPHMAKGLCSTCYDQQWASLNKERVHKTKKRWRKNNPDKVKASHRKHLYGVDNVVVQERLVSQSGLCAICKVNPATDLDHDHATKKFRGLLCGRCNRALGLFNENKETLLGAIDYLTKWKQSNA